jgi:UPF0716 family protein affecting phage T7 exclusion
VLTDFVGFLGLIPFTRSAIRKYVQKRIQKGQVSGRVNVKFGFGGRPPESVSYDAPPDTQWKGQPKSRPDYTE